MNNLLKGNFCLNGDEFIKVIDVTSMYYEILRGFDDYDEDEIKENELNRLDLGIKYIGEGASRMVFSYKDYIIKVPKSEDGELQNKEEIKIYNEIEKHNIKLLVPSYSTVYSDLNVQLKIESMPRGSRK